MSELSEFEHYPRADFDADRLKDNYKTPEGVRARFKLNEFAETPIDIDLEIFEAARIKEGEVVLDVGSSEGRTGRLWRDHYGFDGQFFNLELNIAQFLSHTDMKAWAASPMAGETYYLQGDAAHVPIRPGSVDLVLALFMIYHVPEQQQESALSYLQELLKDDGRLIVATSGPDNKFKHRTLESDQQLRGSSLAPPYMNKGFDSGRAADLLPQIFNYVYQFSQRDNMIIDTPEKADAYLDSLRSLLDQYVPPRDPGDGDVKEALLKIREMIMETIEHQGRFIDHIARDFFVCSKQPLDLDPLKYRNISRVS